MLEELADLAMALAQAAAKKAKAQIEDPKPGPDPIKAFTSLATTVRQLIALEARIADPKAPTTRPNPKPVDEAREFIAEATRGCAKADQAATRRHGPTKRHIEQNIEHRMAAEDITALIEEDMPAYVIVSTICDDLDIRCEVAEQPDEYLIPLSQALEARRNPRPPQNFVWTEEDEEAERSLGLRPAKEGDGPTESTDPPSTTPTRQPTAIETASEPHQ